MLTCIVTAQGEVNTVGTAVRALVRQEWPDGYELLVVCPDERTAEAVQQLAGQYPEVRHLADRGEGKPAALNLALRKARGDICVFSDGDVEVQPGAIRALLAALDDPACGAASGRPISANPTSTMLGYWSHLLTDAGAHVARRRRARRGRFFDCSGYLYAARRSLVPELPMNTLADDAYISQSVWRQGYRIAYAPEAKVLVRYPTTYRDWMLQKVRSTAGAATAEASQPSSTSSSRNPVRMRSFLLEAVEGLPPMLLYPTSAREYWWLICLLAARLHLWARVWSEVHLRRRSHQEVWRRVESTK